MSNTKVAIVTGANKGIGLEITRMIAKKFDGVVYLTSRNIQLGLNAVKDLEKEGIKVNFHQLDVSNKDSIKNLATYIKEKYGGVDVLVNNAAILYEDKTIPNLGIVSNESIGVQVENTININFYGILNLFNEFYDIFRQNARIINVTSDWGLIHYIENPKYKEKLLNRNLSIQEILDLVQDYVESAKRHDYSHYPHESYKMSKNFLNALTREQQKLVDKEERKRNIAIHSVNPGDVSSDMNPNGVHSVAEGAQTIVYLALLPNDVTVERGKFWYNHKVYDWDDDSLRVFTD